MPSYTLPIESLLDLTLSEVKERVEKADKVGVGSLTLRELSSHATHPNGVYLFFQEGSFKPFYIGRASSRSFIGRLPSHFEPHADFWMNGLSKGMQKMSTCTYQEGIKAALDCNLLLIGFQYPERKEDFLLRKQRINTLELVLQRYLSPTLTSRASSYTGQEILASLLPIQVQPNPSIERTRPGKPGRASHVKR